MACNCRLCETGEKFRKLIDRIQDLETKEFFTQLYSKWFELGEETEVQTIYLNNLKTLYPKIYSEIATIRTLTIDGEHPYFPEVSIK